MVNIKNRSGSADRKYQRMNCNMTGQLLRNIKSLRPSLKTQFDLNKPAHSKEEHNNNKDTNYIVIDDDTSPLTRCMTIEEAEKLQENSASDLEKEFLSHFIMQQQYQQQRRTNKDTKSYCHDNHHQQQQPQQQQHNNRYHATYRPEHERQSSLSISSPTYYNDPYSQDYNINRIDMIPNINKMYGGITAVKEEPRSPGEECRIPGKGKFFDELVAGSRKQAVRLE